ARFLKSIKVDSAVLVLSPTPLSKSEGQRSTHLALELAGRGYAVALAYWRWNQNDWSGQEYQEEQVFQFPVDIVLSDPSKLLNLFAEVSEKVILLEFPFPGFFRLLASANAEGWLTVYDVVDNWEAFNRVGQAPWYQKDFERHVVSTADLVTAVSASLRSRMESLGREDVTLVPNGWPEGIEDKGRKLPLERGEVTLGYFGYLSEAWFDWRLVKEIADRRPSWRFYLVGYGGDWPQRNSMPENVSLLGQRPQDDLAALAANWDVGIVPFKEGLVAADADPIKTYEYLAMGLPVVASGLTPSLTSQAFVKAAHGPEDFIEKVVQATQESAESREERRAFVENSTWSARVDSLLAAIAMQPAVELKRAIFSETL
ncbi:MAG: glycosyltransferase, partial [Anaerolineales bacterium]